MTDHPQPPVPDIERLPLRTIVDDFTTEGEADWRFSKVLSKAPDVWTLTEDTPQYFEDRKARATLKSKDQIGSLIYKVRVIYLHSRPYCTRT